MDRDQPLPNRWLIVNRPPDRQLWQALRHLPQGSGILVLHRPDGAMQRRLKRVAKLRRHTLTFETRSQAARVHNARELTQVLYRRPTMVLLSPLYETRSHPDWKPLPRMRAATLARLCRGHVLALGGMNSERYSRVAGLGFDGWAGISAFRI